MKRLFFALFVLLASTSMLFATGQTEAADTGAGDDIVVRWAYWGGESRVRISQEAIDIYEQQNSGVQVNPEISGGAGDHFVKVDTQLAGGSGPDIIQMGGNIGDYVDRDALLPLNQYAGTVLDTDAIDDSAVQSGTLNGNLYGVSTGVTMPALVYNRTLIESVGAPLPATSQSYEEFYEYVVMLSELLPEGVWPMQDIGALPTNSTPFGYWSRYNGTPLYNAEQDRTELTAADATEYVELFQIYREQGLIPPPDIAAGYAETNADTSALIAGRVAIGFMWTNQLAGYQGATTSELGLMEFPGAAENNALWQAPSQFYTVNKNTSIPEETVKFINFLVNSPDAARVLGNDRGASASETARAAGADDPSDQKVLEFLAVAGPHTSAETPHVPNDTELNSTLYLIYQRAAFGQISAAQAGQEIYDLLVRLINS